MALNTLKADDNNNNNNKLTIEDMIPKNAFSNVEAEKEIGKIKEIEDTIDWESHFIKRVEIRMILENFKQ